MISKTDLKHYSVIPNTILFNDSFTSTQKIVYQVIYTMINNENDFYMSNTKFAKKIGMTRGSVINAVRKLKDANLITTFSVKDSKGRTIGRYIYLCKKGGQQVDRGGQYTDKGGQQVDPNKLSNKLRQREQPKPKSVDHQEHNPKPNIMQALTGYFPKVKVPYMLTDASERVDKWLKQYSVQDIQNAIDSAAKYQMTTRSIGSPLNFLSASLRRLDRKRQQSKKTRERHEQDVDIPDLNEYMKEQPKRDAIEEKNIAANMKKKGLV